MITWPSCPVTWRISTLRACSRCARGPGLELFTRCRLSHIWSHVLTSGATSNIWSHLPIACVHRVVPWHLLVLTSSLGAFHWYPRLQPPLSYKASSTVPAIPSHPFCSTPRSCATLSPQPLALQKRANLFCEVRPRQQRQDQEQRQYAARRGDALWTRRVVLSRGAAHGSMQRLKPRAHRPD